ncbi:MAG: MFS transporter [Sulfolobus sp.]
MSNNTNRFISEIMDNLQKISISTWLFLVISASYFFVEYDLFDLSYVLPAIISTFKIPSTLASLALTSTFTGGVIGELSGGYLSDNFGRKFMLIMGLVAYSIATILSALSVNILMLIITRFFVGWGTYVDFNSVVTYLAEISPKRSRGKIISYSSSIGIALGALVVIVVSYLLAPIPNIGWRLVFILGGIVGITFAVLRKDLPESPRWLEKKGKLDEAKLTLEKLHINIQEPLIPSNYDDSHKSSPLANLKILVDKSHLKYFLIFLISWIMFYSAFDGEGITVPTILTEHGYTLASTLRFFVVSGSVAFVFYIISALTAEKTQRKYLATLAALLTGIFMILLGTLYNAILIYVSLASLSSLGAFIFPYTYLLTVEHFPTEVRATAFALTDGIAHLLLAFMPIIILTVSAKYGFFNTMLILAMMMIVGGILLLFTKATTGKALDETSK